MSMVVLGKELWSLPISEHVTKSFVCTKRLESGGISEKWADLCILLLAVTVIHRLRLPGTLTLLCLTIAVLPYKEFFASSLIVATVN